MGRKHRMLEQKKPLLKLSITAEAVEKAHPLEHFILDYCLHQSTQKHA